MVQVRTSEFYTDSVCCSTTNDSAKDKKEKKNPRVRSHREKVNPE